MTPPLTRFILLLSVFLLSPALAAKSIQGPHTVVSLIGGESTAEGIAFGVEFRLEPEWHIYWKNPGDSGAAPKFDFKTEGGTLSEIKWPVPERVRFNDLTNYGYNRRVVFPFRVRPNAGAGKVKVSLDLEYLVCKIECIPGFGTLSAEFTVGKVSALAANADPHHPIPLETSPFSMEVIERTEDVVRFALKGDEDFRKFREVDIFPVDGSLFASRAPQFKEENGNVKAELRWETNAKRETENTRFLLKVVDANGVRGFEIPVSLKTSSVSLGGLGRAILFAFLGGLLLNLMPCVFPVLSIKILSLVAESRSPAAARKGGWLYSFGVVATFLALASILLGLRASGEQLGWGFQLQSPAFVLAMALLFFLVGLNFLGVFEIGYGLMRWGGSLKVSSSFGTGVLATLVATPCTAPFMGAALGASLLLPWWGALAVFFSLGSGMALPFLLLSYFPKALERLPRPGAWMETLKEFFAFPLFASTVWLGWVLVQQTGERGFLILGLSLLGISLAVWLQKSARAPAILFGALTIVAGIALASPREKAASSWQPFSKAALTGGPTFIDFTAAWCLTCQWNKKAVLDTDPVQKIFSENGVKLIRADWTDRDPDVTEALAGYGRTSVPLYVFIPAEGEPILLPELISKQDIEKLFHQRSEK